MEFLEFSNEDWVSVPISNGRFWTFLGPISSSNFEIFNLFFHPKKLSCCSTQRIFMAYSQNRKNSATCFANLYYFSKALLLGTGRVTIGRTTNSKRQMASSLLTKEVANIVFLMIRVGDEMSGTKCRVLKSRAN